MFKKLLTVAAFIVTATMLGSVPVESANAQHNSQPKITICHATNSATNPYDKLTVSQSSVNGISGNSENNNADHYGQHTGPVAYSYEQANNIKHKAGWGDIIPPVAGFHSGLNWTEVGKAVYYNNCNFPKSASASIDTVAATCALGEKLVYGTALNATYSGTPNGTYGPSNYSVTATAKNDSLFFTNQGPKATLTFIGSLDGKRTDRGCDIKVYAKSFAHVDPTCEKLGSYTINSTNGINYLIGVKTVAAGTYKAAAGTTVQVTAVAQSGYVLEGTTLWTYTFPTPDECVVTPEQPEDIISVNTSSSVDCTTKMHSTITTTSTTTYELVDTVWVAQKPVIVSSTVSREASTDELALCASDDNGDVLGDSAVVELPNTSGGNTIANSIALAAIATIVTTLSVIARIVLGRRV